MPEIRPFPGVRYNPEKIKDFAKVVAPPYDVIDSAKHADLLARHDRNCVRLILGDSPGQVGDYTQGAHLMGRWMSDGTLIRDSSPKYYLIDDSFLLPGEHTPRRRWGIIGRVRLEPLDTGRIHPHERTHKGPREDRLRVMKAFRANLSQVFALFDGDAAVVKDTLSGTFASTPDVDITDGDGIGRRMWVIGDPEITARLSALLSDRDFYIADGHHRYETALAYAQEMAATDPDPTPERGYNFLMMALIGMEDPGLAILPTHRLLYGFEDFEFSRFSDCLAKFFEMTPVEPGVESAIRAGSPPKSMEGRGFLLYDPGNDSFVRARMRDGIDLAREIPGLSKPVRELDVTLAEQLVMMRCLGMTPEQINHQEHLEYFKDVIRAMEKARVAGQVLVIMHSTDMKDLVAVTSARERMPQKSTFFFPKLLTGLVLYNHGD